MPYPVNRIAITLFLGIGIVPHAFANSQMEYELQLEERYAELKEALIGQCQRKIT